MATRTTKKKSARKPKTAPVKAEPEFRLSLDPGIATLSMPIHLPPEVLADLAWKISQEALKRQGQSILPTPPHDLDKDIEEQVCVFNLALSGLASVFGPSK